MRAKKNYKVIKAPTVGFAQAFAGKQVLDQHASVLDFQTQVDNEYHDTRYWEIDD